MESIPDEFRDVFEKRAVATLATLLPDGSPHSVPVWVDYDGTHVQIVTRKETRKHRNVENDPRVAITIIDPDDPYRYVEVRGKVAKRTEDDDLEFVDRQARRYWDVDEYLHARDARIAIEASVDAPLELKPSFKLKPSVIRPSTSS